MLVLGLIGKGCANFIESLSAPEEGNSGTSRGGRQLVAESGAGFSQFGLKISKLAMFLV